MRVFYQPHGTAWGNVLEAGKAAGLTAEQVLSSWDGFISPGGDFYGVRPTKGSFWNGSEDCHEDFAIAHFNGKLPFGFDTFKDALVSSGWVTCTFAVSAGYRWIDVADMVFPKCATTEQRKTASLILAVRGIDGSTVKGGVYGE